MNYTGKLKPFQEPNDRCDRNGCQPEPCNPCNPHPKPGLCPTPAKHPCYPPFISPTPEIAEGMSVMEQVNVLTKKVNTAMCTYNDVMARCYQTLHNMECAAQENGAYYNNHEVWTEEGYSAEDSCPYTIIHKACVDRNGQPIRMDLHLAYGNTTNSQITQDAFNASNVARANILIPAIPLTGKGWYGNVFYKGAPLPSNDEPTLYTVGFTRSGVMNVYSNQITPDQMQRDCIVNAMGVSGVLAMQGAITNDEYRANIPNANIKTARVVMGQNPETREVMMLVCGGDKEPGMISLNCANILLKYGCTTIVEVCEGNTACAMDKGSMLFVPNNAEIPDTYAYWVISRECFYKNDYQRELADLTQNYGYCVWVNLLNNLQVEGLSERITQEIQDRIDGDNTLNELIQQEEAARKAAVEALQKALDAETARAESAETTLQENIDKEVQNRIDDVNAEQVRAEAAEKQLQANIDAEQAAREAADTTLQENLDAETSAREAADTQLQKNITSEETARKEKDTDLQKQINTEVSERTDQVSDLTAKLDKEVGERKGADAVLQTQVTANTENSNNALLQVGLLNTRVQTAEGKINQNITDIGTNKGAIDGLTTRVTTAEGTIASNTSRIVALESGGGGGEPVPDPELDKRVTVLETDMTTVKSDIATNKTNIGTNITNIANLSTDVTNITGTVTTNTAAIAANKTAIDKNAADIAALEAGGFTVFYIGSTGTHENDGKSSITPLPSISSVVTKYSDFKQFYICVVDNVTVTVSPIAIVSNSAISIFSLGAAKVTYTCTSGERFNNCQIQASNVDFIVTGEQFRSTFVSNGLAVFSDLNSANVTCSTFGNATTTVAMQSSIVNCTYCAPRTAYTIGNSTFNTSVLTFYSTGSINITESSVSAGNGSVTDSQVTVDDTSTLIINNKFWGVNGASPKTFYIGGNGDGSSPSSPAPSLAAILNKWPNEPVYRVAVTSNFNEAVPSTPYTAKNKNIVFMSSDNTAHTYSTFTIFNQCNMFFGNITPSFSDVVQECSVQSGGDLNLIYSTGGKFSYQNNINCRNLFISGSDKSISSSNVMCNTIQPVSSIEIFSSNVIVAKSQNIPASNVTESTVISGGKIIGAASVADLEPRVASLETTAAALPSTYAAKSHTHSGYAASSHTHSNYALTSHTHSNYADSTHTHDQYLTTLDLPGGYFTIGGSESGSRGNYASLSALVKAHPLESSFIVKINGNVSSATGTISNCHFKIYADGSKNIQYTTKEVLDNCSVSFKNITFEVGTATNSNFSGGSRLRIGNSSECNFRCYTITSGTRYSYCSFTGLFSADYAANYDFCSFLTPAIQQARTMTVNSCVIVTGAATGTITKYNSGSVTMLSTIIVNNVMQTAASKTY